MWEPGTTHGYHALTYGWLAGELVRRVDGRTIGTYFAEEVATPLGLDFWIGLPESEEQRVSTLESAPPPSDPAELAMMMQMMGPGTIGFKALTMNGTLMALGPGREPLQHPCGARHRDARRERDHQRVEPREDVCGDGRRRRRRPTPVAAR